ncbi:MAG: hypothetical protein ACKV2T_20895 [Kofleriaceae bacterium]
MRKLLAATLLLIGCGTDGGTDGVELIDGFDPPAPPEGWIQLVAPPVRDIAPGADVTMCAYVDKRIVDETDIVDYHSYQSNVGAHHTILYAVTQQEEANVHECTEDDMVNSRYLAGGGADSPGLVLPENIVFRMPANTQLMIQSHWINATDETIDGQAAFNVKTTSPQPNHQVAQLLTIGPTSFTLPVGEGAVSGECTLGETTNALMVGGHMHEWGTHGRITHTPMAAAEATVLWETAWNEEYQFNPPRSEYTPANPLVLGAGDKIHIDCEYDNDTGGVLPFPREMCFAFAYVYPMDRQIDCLNGVWPTN